LEGSKGKAVALKFTGVGRGGVPKRAFQPRIKNALLRRVRLKRYQPPQDFSSADTTYSDWCDSSCQSLDIQVDRPSYVHIAVANINGSFGEFRKLRQEIIAQDRKSVV